MSSQPRLDFDQANATIEAAAPRTRANLVICARPGCGKPRPPDAKPGRFCSHICRREDSRRRERESYLAPRPLPEEPEARRDVGKAIAAANNRHQIAQAQELALEYLAAHPVVIISDIRAFAAFKGIKLEWWKPWSGNVFMLSPWFEFTGVRRKTTHKRGNARKVNEYRLSPKGREAWRNRQR